MPWPTQRQKPPRGIVANLLYTLIGENKRELFQDQLTTTAQDTLTDFYKLYNFVLKYIPDDDIPSTVRKVMSYYESFINKGETTVSTTITVPSSTWDTSYKLFRLIMFDPRTCNAAQTLPQVRFYLNRNLDDSDIDSNSFGSNDRIFKKVGVITFRLDKAVRVNGYTLENKPPTDTWMLLGSNEESAFDDLGDDVQTYMARLSTEQSNWQELDRYPKQVVQDVRENDNNKFKSYSLTSMIKDYTEASKILIYKYIEYLQGIFKLIKSVGDLSKCMQDLKQLQERLFFQNTSLKFIVEGTTSKEACINSLTEKFKQQVYDSARTVMAFADSCQKNSNTTATPGDKKISVTTPDQTYTLAWTDIQEDSPTNILQLTSLKDIYMKYQTYTSAYKVLVQQVATPPSTTKPAVNVQDTAILPTISLSLFTLPEVLMDSYTNKVFYAFKQAVLNMLADYYNKYREDNGNKVEYSKYYDAKYQEVFYIEDSNLEKLAKNVANAQLEKSIYDKDKKTYAQTLVYLAGIYQFYQTLLIGLLANKDLAKEKYKLVKMIDVFSYYYSYLTNGIPTLSYPNIPSTYERDNIKQTVFQMNADVVQSNYTKYSRLLFYDESSASATATVNDIVGVAKKYLNQRIDYFKSLCTAQYKGKQLYSYYVDFDAQSTSASTRIIDVYEKNVQNDLATLSNVRLSPTTSILASDDVNSLNMLQLDRLISLHTKYEAVIQRIDNQVDGYSKRAMAVIDIDVLRDEIRPIMVIYNSIYASVYINMTQKSVEDIIYDPNITTYITDYKLSFNDKELNMGSTKDFNKSGIRDPNNVRPDSSYTDLEFLDNLENFLDINFTTAVTDLKTNYYSALDNMNNFLKNRAYEIMKVCRIFELKYLAEKDYMNSPSTYDAMTQTKETLVRLSSLRGFGSTTTTPADVNIIKSIKTGFSASTGVTAEFVKNSITQNQIDKISAYLKILSEFSSFISEYNKQLNGLKNPIGRLATRYSNAYKEIVADSSATQISPTSGALVLSSYASNYTFKYTSVIKGSLPTDTKLIVPLLSEAAINTESNTLSRLSLAKDKYNLYKSCIIELLTIGYNAKYQLLSTFSANYKSLERFINVSLRADGDTSISGANSGSIDKENKFRWTYSYGDAGVRLTSIGLSEWTDSLKNISVIKSAVNGITIKQLYNTIDTDEKIKTLLESNESLKKLVLQDTNLEFLDTIAQLQLTENTDIEIARDLITANVSTIRSMYNNLTTYMKNIKLYFYVTGTSSLNEINTFVSNSFDISDSIHYFLVGGGGGGGHNIRGGWEVGYGGGGSGFLTSSKEFKINDRIFPNRISNSSTNVVVNTNTSPIQRIKGNTDLNFSIGIGGQVNTNGGSTTFTYNGKTYTAIGGFSGKKYYTSDDKSPGMGGSGFNSGGNGMTGDLGYNTAPQAEAYGGTAGSTSSSKSGVGKGGYFGNADYGSGGDASSWCNSWEDGAKSSGGGGGAGGVGFGNGGKGAASCDSGYEWGSTSGTEWSGAGGGGGTEARSGSSGSNGYVLLEFSRPSDYPFTGLNLYQGSIAAFTNPPSTVPAPSHAFITYPTFNPYMRTTEFVKPPPISTPTHIFKPATCFYQQPGARSFQQTQPADWASVWSQQALQTRTAAQSLPMLQAQPQLQQQQWKQPCVKTQPKQQNQLKNAPLYQQGASLDSAFGGSLLS